MKKRNWNRKHPELGELKYDSYPKDPYGLISIPFFLILILYFIIYIRSMPASSLSQIILIFLIWPPCLFWSIGMTKSTQRFRIYSEGINITVIRYEGNPHKGLKGWGKGRKKVKYKDIVSIHPFSGDLLFTSGKRKGLTFMLPGGKKGRLAAQFGLQGERSKEAIQIISEQMGDLWYEKYKEKNPDRVT